MKHQLICKRCHEPIEQGRVNRTERKQTMQHGGKRPGAGRPRGSTNKFSAETRAAAVFLRADAIDCCEFTMVHWEETLPLRSLD